MIDLRLVRENPDLVRASQRARGADESLVDALLAADAERRAAVKAADDLRGEQKAASQAVRGASKEERPAVLEKARALATVEEVYADLEREWAAALGAERLAGLRADLTAVLSTMAGGRLPRVRTID